MSTLGKPQRQHRILRILEDQIEHWALSGLTGLSPEGRERLDSILAFPARFRRLVERMEARATARTYEFDVVFRREFSIE